MTPEQIETLKKWHRKINIPALKKPNTHYAKFLMWYIDGYIAAIRELFNVQIGWKNSYEAFEKCSQLYLNGELISDLTEGKPNE